VLLLPEAEIRLLLAGDTDVVTPGV
jgi:hypothetical protein